MPRDEWEIEFEKWKAEKRKKLADAEKKLAVEAKKVEREIADAEKKVSEEIIEAERKIAEGITKAESEVEDYVTAPRHVKVFKILALAIPIVVIAFLLYANVIASHDFNYLYDIGSEGEKYLTPTNRITEPVAGEPNYRALTSQLVYFDVPVARGAETVEVEVKFRDVLPSGATMSLGAKDQDVWHYTYHSIYNPALDSLNEFESEGNVYRVNTGLDVVTLNELRDMNGVVIATDKEYVPRVNAVEDYRASETRITSALRGAHTAYVYASGDLTLTVSKQDINWYEGSDELEVSVYDMDGILLENMTIEDDGVTNVDKKIAPVQSKTFEIEGLDAGVYKIEFRDFDGLIREIDVNTNKVVFPKVFLADNSLYGVDTRPVTLYVRTVRDETVEMITYHAAGLQKVRYNGNVFDFRIEDEAMYLPLEEGEYYLTFPENDVIVSGTPYFAFSQENYFEPFTQRVVGIKNDPEWLRQNVDYIVTDYSVPEREGDWLIARTVFDIREEELFVKDNKLSVLFNVPHLAQEATQNDTLPVDWIKINVHKPGVWE